MTIDIIATLNNSRHDKETLKAFIKSGMTIGRINMSHSSFSEARKLVDYIRICDAELCTNTKIMIDLAGPELRIRGIQRELNVESGENIKIGLVNSIGELSSDLPIYFSNEINISSLQVGNKVLIQDGLIEATVSAIGKSFLEIRIKEKSTIRQDSHVSIPGARLFTEFLSSKDKEDIIATATLKPDFYALSFVQSGDDVISFKTFLAENCELKETKTLSKFETLDAVKNIDDIIQYSDYSYIARGDLGVEISLELIPTLQKYISQKCVEANQPFFVATQMLESMVENSIPTRAEVSDVGNACFDGASGVTLSDETAIGSFPLESIKWMKRIITSNRGTVLENINILLK